MGNRARFIAWVQAYGYTRLATALKVPRTFIHSWTNPKKPVAPANKYATRIVQFSRDEPFQYGPLTLEDLVSETTGLRGSGVEGEASHA